MIYKNLKQNQNSLTIEIFFNLLYSRESLGGRVGQLSKSKRVL